MTETELQAITAAGPMAGETEDAFLAGPDWTP